MSQDHPRRSDAVPAPAAGLNVALTAAAAAVAVLSLHQAGQAAHPLAKLAWAGVFSCVGNTLFALLHESVHFTYSRDRRLNELAGVLCATLFPTGLTFQRVCHLNHHLRNRTDHEMFDMYYPSDNRLLKYTQFYAILTGVYWVSVVFGWLVYLLAPFLYGVLARLAARSEAVRHTGAVMLAGFVRHPRAVRIRLELLLTVAVQAALIIWVAGGVGPWLLCYWLFGLNWGGLQYADHAWSPRDIRAGAWDLRVHPVWRAIFLNYHYHRAHHMHPQVPWNHLGRYVDRSQPRPTFVAVWLRMWRGPTPAPAGAGPAELPGEFRRALLEGM